MLLSDGTAPGHEGRGYVLRRLLRRAVRSMRHLGHEDPVLPELLAVARDCMAPGHPEVTTAYDRIAEQAAGEEDAFPATLKQGTTVLDTAVARVEAAGGSSLPGAQAFLLHDTYGFPVDLTLEMAAEQGIEVDREGFTALMREQRERARADARARKSGGTADTSALRTVLDEHGPTDRRAWDTLATESRVLALLGPAGPLPAAREGDIVAAVLDRTPFYAESGGQDSDAGRITATAAEADVLDVQRPLPGLVVHRVHVTAGELAVGDAVHAAVDPEWRLGARQAHSGTHVLHAALRQILGPTALQSGSYNRPGYLRLDFPRRGALSAAARSEIEEAANEALRRDLPVGVRWMPLPRRGSWARWRSSTRRTARKYGSSRSAARGRGSCAAGPMSSTPPRSGSSRSPRSRRSAPACAAWRRRSAPTASPTSPANATWSPASPNNSRPHAPRRWWWPPPTPPPARPATTPPHSSSNSSTAAAAAPPIWRRAAACPPRTSTRPSRPFLISSPGMSRHSK